MALYNTTSLCYLLPWLYFTIRDSTLLYHMALIESTLLYITLPWFYFTLLYYTLLYHCSTSLFFTLHYSTMALLHSTLLYISLRWLYFTVLDSTLPYLGSSSLYLTLYYPTMVLHSKKWLCCCNQKFVILVAWMNSWNVWDTFVSLLSILVFPRAL